MLKTKSVTGTRLESSHDLTIGQADLAVAAAFWHLHRPDKDFQMIGVTAVYIAIVKQYCIKCCLLNGNAIRSIVGNFEFQGEFR